MCACARVSACAFLLVLCQQPLIHGQPIQILPPTSHPSQSISSYLHAEWSMRIRQASNRTQGYTSLGSGATPCNDECLQLGKLQTLKLPTHPCATCLQLYGHICFCIFNIISTYWPKQPLITLHLILLHYSMFSCGLLSHCSSLKSSLSAYENVRS